MTATQTSAKPVVAGYDTGDMAALGMAADQAAVRHTGLRVLVRRAVPVWTSHLAMGVCPPAAFDDDDPAAELAREAVARLRHDHPGTAVDLYGTARSLPRAMLREAGDAAMLVTGRDTAHPDATTRLAGRAGCPVLSVPDGSSTDPAAPVLLVGADAPGDAAEFAMAQASARGVPVLACDLGPATGEFADAVVRAADRHPSVEVYQQGRAGLTRTPAGIAVLRTPGRRGDAAWPLLNGLLRDAPYPVATVPAAH
ncbi:hypothetical protein Cme02nite_64030 [Catellatospora methionotrophica]|uniref:Universal stress protein family protein n=1 Tax=Catellatospora methionotrophica TaxID=121620 RepID=A0A8J3PK41_9ACTN|nr:hypothetical protein [Catellatospora methionotrophica]GIG18071.1 hypothetical protein Cme02nite_64030 [Catellatospora methionotrophica]